MSNDSHVERALQSLGHAWPAEGSIAARVMQRIEPTGVRLRPAPRRRTFVRAMLAVAASTTVLAGLWWALRADNWLYAQALKGVHRARTFQMIITVISPDRDKPVQAIATYMQRNVGLRVEEAEEVYLCLGKESWRYKKNQGLVIHSATPGIDEVIDHKLDVELGQVLKEAEYTRYEPVDQEIDGQPCRAYLIVKIHRQVPPDPKGGERRMIVLLDEQSRIRRIITERRADDSWVVLFTNDWKYDVPLDATLFEPRFGEGLKLVDGDKAFDEFTSLDKALYREERSGVIYAIHRAARVAGGGIALAASVRGTPETLQKFPLTQRMFRFDLYAIDGPARILQWSPQGNGNLTIDLASVDHQGINVHWLVMMPRGRPASFFDLAQDKVKFLVGYTPQGEFGKRNFTDERGVTHHVTWDVEIDLPRPAELPSLDTIARRTYSDVEALAMVPFRNLDMGVGADGFKHIAQPDQTTAADFAQAVAAHLRYWQQGDVDFQLTGQFTAESRKQLAEMRSGGEMPETIGLSYLPIVDDALLKRIAEHTALKHLYLDGTKITDTGLTELAGLTELEQLSLEGTSISDAGLARLAPLKSLRQLRLGNTKVTDAGVARLKEAIPGLDIETMPSPRWW